MAGPAAVSNEPNKPSTHNTHFKPYPPPNFLRARTLSNLDSQSTGETESTPTPDPRHILKDAILPLSLNHPRGSSTALDSTSELPVLRRISPQISTTSSGSVIGDTDDEGILNVLDEYNIEGMSMEDLKLWMQTAPADQRLESVHNADLSLSNAVNARYDIEGISREDLELWHEFAPPDQKLEARSDTEMEIDDMGSEPTSDIPKLDLGPLQKALPLEVRRASTSSIEQSKSMQVNHFIRRHPFLQTSLVRHTTSERRSFEKDIYDYARGLGLSPGEAHKEVFKGRGLCGEEEYHSDDTALGDEVDDSANTLRRLSTPSVSMLEQSHSSQPSDVPAIAKTPRGRSRRKKQSTMDPLVNADAQVVVMEAEVSAAQCESVQVPRCRSKTSKDTTSKFFPNECELGKKRKRKTADETDVPEQKKPKKEAKKKKSKKVDGQATANTQIDQDIQFTHSPSNPEGHGKGGDVPAKPRAPTDDAVEGKEDLDTVGQRGEVTAKSKNRKKMKKRKDKSKGSETTTATTSTSAAESLSIVVAADVGSDLNGLATADKSTDHEVNEPLSKQHLSATPKPVVASEANGDHALNLEAVRESWRATRRLRKQIRRRAINKAKRQLRAENNAAAVSPPVTKIAKPDENDKAHDDHQINQTTELPTSSINDLMGTSGLSKKDRPGSTAPAVAHEPIDPKSTMEARRNLLRSAKPESVEYGTTATISKHDLKEIKNIPLLEEEAGESQADEEHAAKKRLRKRKSGDKKEHATNDADSDNVKTKKVKQVKTEDDNAAVDGALDAVMAMLVKSRSGSGAGIEDFNASPMRAVVIERSPIKKEDYPRISSSAETSPLSSAPSSPVFSPVLPPLDLESETDGFQPSRKTSEAGDELSHRTRLSRSKSAPPSSFTALRPPTTPTRKSPRKPSAKISPYFPKSPSERVSCIPFPPLSATCFGLVQEKLSHDPFRLLIAVIFLNKTKGSVAMPTFYDLMARYPTPASLAAAKQVDLVAMIQHLGLQNQRAATCIKLAQAWLDTPPQKGKRYRRLHYPLKDDGKDIKPTEGPLSDTDQRIAWEVGHLPGIGAYAIDSWRIFCRDELRRLPHGLPATLTPETRAAELEKEWTRVLPRDKELRAYLRWRWLRLGWTWNPLTGAKQVATEAEIAAAESGGVIREGESGWAVEADEVVRAGVGRGGCGGEGEGGKMVVVHG